MCLRKHTTVCCQILQLCFLGISSIVKEFNNYVNQLLKSNLKVTFRQRIFSVINSSRLLAPLDLAFLSYRIQAHQTSLREVPTGTRLIRGKNHKVCVCEESLPCSTVGSGACFLRQAEASEHCWLLTEIVPGQGWHHCSS